MVSQLKCAICGLERKYNIGLHLKYKHDMSSDEYTEKFGFPVTTNEFRELISNETKKAMNIVEMKEHISKKSKEMWSDPDYKSKMCKIQKKSHDTQEFKEGATNRAKKLWGCPEFRRKQKEYKRSPEFLESVKSPSRARKIGLSSKNRWEDDEYKQKVTARLREVVNDPNGGFRQYLYSEKWEETRIKISDTISGRIANGELGFGKSDHFYKGWYYNGDGAHWHHSGLELDTMQFLDGSEKVVKWTERHGVRIKYIHPDEQERNYVPDFLVILINGKELLIEMKGFGDEDEVIAKKEAAEKLYDSYRLIYSVGELREIINAEIHQS